jgi:hypothetical protein
MAETVELVLAAETRIDTSFGTYPLTPYPHGYPQKSSPKKPVFCVSAHFTLNKASGFAGRFSSIKSRCCMDASFSAAWRLFLDSYGNNLASSAALIL